MSWSINVIGNPDEVGKAFDAYRESCASWGMIEPEQLDIGDARNLALHFAETHGRVAVSAGGHWNATYGNDPAGPEHTFGRFYISIDAVPQLDEEPVAPEVTAI